MYFGKGGRLATTAGRVRVAHYTSWDELLAVGLAATQSTICRQQPSVRAVGTAMHSRLSRRARRQRNADPAPVRGWWNGGMRNTATYHTTIEILTRSYGNPRPWRSAHSEKQLTISDLPLQIAPRTWHYASRSINSMETNRASWTIARGMEELLYNIWRMG